LIRSMLSEWLIVEFGCVNQNGLASTFHTAFGYDKTMTVRIRYFTLSPVELFMSIAVYAFW